MTARKLIAGCRSPFDLAQSVSMKRVLFKIHAGCLSVFAAATLLAACGSAPSVTSDAGEASEVRVVTGFRLDVTVEEETLKEKRLRALAETEVTSVRRDSALSSAGQCVDSVRPGDIVARDRETTPGRMALTGAGAMLTQSGAAGRLKADARVYFLGPMENADAALEHQLGDFILTSTDHPALAGAKFATFRLDIVATPAGDPRKPISCVPNLGVSQRYEGDGERRSFSWHGVDLTSVPERFLTGMLQDTKDVTIAVLDAVTRVPIANARVQIKNLDGKLMNYALFSERYLSGIQDAFVLDLYGSFANSDFFKFTNVQTEYRNEDKLRLLSDGVATLPVIATASGYRPVMGQAVVGAAQRNLNILMVREDAADAASVPAGIQTN